MGEDGERGGGGGGAEGRLTIEFLGFAWAFFYMTRVKTEAMKTCPDSPFRPFYLHHMENSFAPAVNRLHGDQVDTA